MIIAVATVIVAYTAFFAITLTAIVSLPPSMAGLAVPLGIAAAIAVLIAAYQFCG